MTTLLDPAMSIVDARARLSITALWQRLSLPGEPSKKCRSPFREDRKPSFEVSVDPSDGFEKWKDWSTGEHGDAIDFLAKARSLTNSQAIAEFCALARGATVEGGGYNGATFRKAETKKHRKIHPENFRIGTKAEFAVLSRLRSISVEGLKLASDAGLLRFGDCCGYPSWTLLDQSFRLAQSRRLDGQEFPAAGEQEERKAHTWRGSDQSWPLNCESLRRCDKAALVEGAPDMLAAFGYAFAEKKEVSVVITAMLGASCRISAAALPLFAGKQVRIFAHADDAGLQAALRWWEQLETVGANLSWFDFSSLTQENGDPVKDFNDLTSISYDDFESKRVLWEVLPS